MEIKCSDTPGIRRKDLKPYIEDFCINYVHSQPRDVGEIDKEYTIIDPWSQWKVKFTWSTKQLWAERNCEASYKAMTRKKACGMFRTKGRKVAVAMKAFGEEHPGPESCESRHGAVTSSSTSPLCCRCRDYGGEASDYGRWPNM
jgi:hypothetical protein